MFLEHYSVHLTPKCHDSTTTNDTLVLYQHHCFYSVSVCVQRGDLNVCDNWRGISLLDVAGKLLGRILQERLQHVAERVLPDSQCGFRQGRGCVDMIFAARQLVEKAREHNCLLFTLFTAVHHCAPQSCQKCYP